MELAQGWVPFPNTEAMAPHTRSPALESDDQLASRIAFARGHADAVGRTSPLTICYALLETEPAAAKDRIARLEELGVDWLTVGFAAKERSEYIEKLRAFARDIL